MSEFPTQSDDTTEVRSLVLSSFCVAKSASGRRNSVWKFVDEFQEHSEKHKQAFQFLFACCRYFMNGFISLFSYVVNPRFSVWRHISFRFEKINVLKKLLVFG